MNETCTSVVIALFSGFFSCSWRFYGLSAVLSRVLCIAHQLLHSLWMTFGTLCSRLAGLNLQFSAMGLVRRIFCSSRAAYSTPGTLELIRGSFTEYHSLHKACISGSAGSAFTYAIGLGMTAVDGWAA